MFAVLLSGGQNDLIQWQKVIICDSVLCFASPVCPGSWRTRQCSLWPVHQTAGCRAAPYTEWRSPTGWLQRPTRHWLWWIYPEEKNHIWKFNTPTLKYFVLFSVTLWRQLLMKCWLRCFVRLTKKIRYDKNVKASALDLVWVRLDPLFFRLTLQLQKTLHLCNHIHDAEQESYWKKTLQQKRCFIVLVCKPLLVLPLEGRKLLKNS